MGVNNVKTHLVLPEDLIKDIRRYISKRKMSQFIAEATREKLNRLKLEKALNLAAGAWKNKNHPDLKTKKDVDKFIRKMRKSADNRSKRLINV